MLQHNGHRCLSTCASVSIGPLRAFVKVQSGQRKFEGRWILRATIYGMVFLVIGAVFRVTLYRLAH